MEAQTEVKLFNKVWGTVERDETASKYVCTLG